MPKKQKKTKAELEEERLVAEEDLRKQKLIDDKRKAEEAERARLEALRIAAERKAFREEELRRLDEENGILKELLSDRSSQMLAERIAEVCRTHPSVFVFVFVAFVCMSIHLY